MRCPSWCRSCACHSSDVVDVLSVCLGKAQTELDDTRHTKCSQLRVAQAVSRGPAGTGPAGTEQSESTTALASIETHFMEVEKSLAGRKQRQLRFGGVGSSASVKASVDELKASAGAAGPAQLSTHIAAVRKCGASPELDDTRHAESLITTFRCSSSLLWTNWEGHKTSVKAMTETVMNVGCWCVVVYGRRGLMPESPHTKGTHKTWAAGNHHP